MNSVSLELLILAMSHLKLSVSHLELGREFQLPTTAPLAEAMHRLITLGSNYWPVLESEQLLN